MQAIIFSGIQATGKTTFYVQHFLRSHVHISLDLLKTRHREQQFFDLCLATQMPCVIDNTNPTREDRQRYINAAKARKYEVVGYVFQSDIGTAIQRNSLRKGKENIPEIGIKSTFKKLEPVTQDEGFDKIFDILTIDNQFIIKERKMKFDELDLKMRVYETANDRCVLPNMYMVARIDGRGFTKLTKDKHKFQAPFDERFRDIMVETVKHLMTCGFNIIYGYTESDEISLLFHLDETAFSRKIRKYNSILAGEASAKFSVLLGDIGAFDCRISELPNAALVTDYFRWRNEDAHRNAINAHCYWRLRQDNFSQRDATSKIKNISTAAKNELLFQYGINFNELPNWQKRGIGIYWKNVERIGFNPKTKQEVVTQRRTLFVDYDLPMREDYSIFVASLLENTIIT